MSAADSGPAARLRQLLGGGTVIRSLGVHDVFSARLAEAGGLELLFLGGFGAAASMLGQPDVGLLTLTEMTDFVRRTTAALRIPVIADGDTGHGDLHNVRRTVRDFESAGAAGMLLEDQVAPKRCGHFAGKQIIPIGEMLLKLRVALEARRNPDFVIVARTDARAVDGLDAALERARQFGAAGADICFIEAPVSPEEVRRIAAEVPYPLLANMLTGGATPIYSVAELGQMGYRIVVCPIETLLLAGFAIKRLVAALQTTGRVDHLAGEMLSFAEIKELLGLPEIMQLRSRTESGRPESQPSPARLPNRGLCETDN